MLVRLCFFLVMLATAAVPTGVSASIAFPNEPAGSTPINDWGHNTVVGGGWYSVYGETGVGGPSTIVTDNSAPLSSPLVLQQRWPAGGVGGNIGGGGSFFPFPTYYPDVFWGNYMWVDPSFEQHPSGSKLGWIHTRLNNAPHGNQLIYSLIGTGPFCLRTTYQNATVNNCHVGECGGTGTANFYPSSGSCFNGGTWVRIEQYFRPATCITCTDGIWKIWVNGSMVMNITTMNSEAIYPDAVSHITVWGGVGGVKTRDSYIRWDHEYISIPNCGSACGAITPPTSTQPSTVSDLSVTPLSSTSLNVEFTTSTNTDLYDIRYSPDSISWGAAQSVSFGTCKVPYVPGTAGLKTGCSITGLQPDTTYQVQLVGKKNPNTFSLLSNIATGRTATSPGGGGGGGTTPVVSTTYNYYQQFSGVQGKDGWQYLEADNTPLVFNPSGDSGLGLWEGSQLYQSLWSTGFHPGAISGSKGTKLRFTVPNTSTAVVSGSVKDYDTSCGVGVTFTVLYNGVTKYIRTIGIGDGSETTYSFTQSVSVGDIIDFLVEATPGGVYCNVTMLNPIIILSTGGGGVSIPTPTITNIAPISGLPGAQVVISGSNFGSTTGSSTVKFNGVTAVVSASTPTEITVTVPGTATTGLVTVQTAGGTASSGVPFTVSTAVVQPAPSDIQLLSTDTYRVVIGDDVWDLRGSIIPFVIYRNGSCGACNLTGYTLVYSTLLNTVGLEFLPGKFMYWDTKLKEWVIISGSVPYTPPMSVQGTFSFTGTASAGFNVYRSDSAGGTKTKLPLLLTATDRTFTDAQHSFGCYDITSYGQNGEEGPHATEKCTIHGQGLSRDIGLLNPKLVIDFKGRMWELRGSVAPYVPYVDGICRCSMAGYSLRYVEGEAQVEFLPGKWMRFDDLLDDWVIVAP